MRLRYLALASAVLLLTPLAALADTGFSCLLKGTNEVPSNASTASGTGFMTLNNAGTSLTYSVTYSGLTTPRTAAHFHGPAPAGINAGVIFGIASSGPTAGTIAGVWSTITPTQVNYFLSGLMYVNVHNSTFPGGEIRGQVLLDATPTRKTTWTRIKTMYAQPR